MSYLLLIIVAGLVCSLMRILPAVLMRRVVFPYKIARLFQYVPIVLFSAFIATDIFFWEGAFTLNPLTNIKLLPTLIAAIVAYYTKDLSKTVIVGVISITILYVVV